MQTQVSAGTTKANFIPNDFRILDPCTNSNIINQGISLQLRFAAPVGIGPHFDVVVDLFVSEIGTRALKFNRLLYFIACCYLHWANLLPIFAQLAAF